MFTFAERPDKETVQRPMAEGCVCAYGGGGRRGGRRPRRRALVHPQFFYDIRESETTGTEERKSQQEGAEGRGFRLFQVPDI